MAGPLGFFKGLAPRVLYSMPATAICWSTYEFFKFILSHKSREEYQSTVTTVISKSHQTTKSPSTSNSNTNTNTLLPKDVIAAEKIRQDDSSKLGLRYVLPATRVSAADSNSATTTTTTAAATATDIPATIRETSSILPRELPAMSGAGVYTALSLNTRHTETTGRRTYDRGCST